MNIRIDSPSPDVAHQDVEKYFAWLWPAFERSRFAYSMEEFDGELIDGTVLLVRVWSDDEPTAVACCKVQNIIDGKELLIMAVVGVESEYWLAELLESFEKLAAEVGCSHVCFEGRPGWQRLIKDEGYKLHLVTMRKAVNND